ncbi:MAG TPA: MFS transporter [Thermomicrobiales bacterium]|nr:MFS transporter [Thermomicrobiales bacterium]
MSTQEVVSTVTTTIPERSRLRQLPVHALWLTSLVSLFGNQLTGLAVPWFVLETTGSASRTGLTAAAAVIPIIIANFFGGALVDRVSYRAMSIVSDVLSAITVAMIPLLYVTVGLNFPTLLALMFVGAILDAPGSTARTAMVPPLAKLTGIPIERINANLGMITAFSTLFAAPAAGVMIAWLGAVPVLWLNAVTFIVSALIILVMVPSIPRVAAAGESFMGDVRAGLHYVWNHSLLRTIISGALVINMVFAPLFGVAIPWFANQELRSVQALGIMLGGEGLGALAGAFLYGRIGGRIRRRSLLMCSLCLLSIPMIPLAFVSSVIPATALLVLIGMGSGMVNPMLGTFLQTTTPEEYMGRVMGMLAAGAMMAQPLGLLVGGTVLGLAGFQGFIGVVAVTMAVVSAILFFAPALHELDAQPEAGADPVAPGR